jgi:hypothetical protein
MKMMNGLLLLVSAICITLPAQAKVTMAKVSECVAGTNVFSADKCKTSKKKVPCDFDIVKGYGRSFLVGVHIDGVINSKGSVGGPYSYIWVKGEKRVTRRQVDFGGLNRGMIQLVENQKDVITKLIALEVYINHNSTGATYTRYSCGVVNPNQ